MGVCVGVRGDRGREILTGSSHVLYEKRTWKTLHGPGPISYAAAPPALSTSQKDSRDCGLISVRVRELIHRSVIFTVTKDKRKIFIFMIFLSCASNLGKPTSVQVSKIITYIAQIYGQ